MTKAILLAFLTTALLAACSATPYNAPSTSSNAEPAPGTVTVHMNGSVGAAFGYTR
jgi:hypothetical protein